jgi:hypothetical protein
MPYRGGPPKGARRQALASHSRPRKATLGPQAGPEHTPHFHPIAHSEMAGLGILSVRHDRSRAPATHMRYFSRGNLYITRKAQR